MRASRCRRGSGQKRNGLVFQFDDCLVITYLNKRKLKRKRFSLAHNSRIQSVIGGKTRQQKPKTVTSAKSRECMNARTVSSFLFYSRV